jgi:hypothetical protein
MKYILSLLTAAILFMGCKSDANSPKGTVTTFIEAMKKGDIEGVKKLLTKADLSLMNTAEAAAKLFTKDNDIVDKMKAEFIEKSKNVTYTVKDEKIDGDKADVNVDIKENDKTTTQAFKLLKEEGNWKISFTSTGLGMGGKSGDMNMDNINIADSIKKGLDEFKKINMDSLTGSMKEGIEQLKDFQKKNPEAVKKMEEAINKMKEAADKNKH